MRLYCFPHSTNVERVTLALAYKGLEVEPVSVDPADRSAVEEVSGQPLVPVLDDDGAIVVDSTEILRHLEARHPDPPLYPAAEARRAELDVYIDWFNRVWKRAPNQMEAELSEGEPNAARLDALSAAMRAHLDLHEALLADRDYLFANGFSAADCVAFPFLKYALGRAGDDDELFHRILDEQQSVEGRPRLEAWVRRVDARPRAV